MSAAVDLRKLADRKTLQLTTVGRRSGKPRAVTIWFAVTAPDTLVVQHVARRPAQWYRNLCAQPQVTVDLGEGPVSAVARPLEDPADVERVLEKIGSKYWWYRLIRLFGGRANAAVAAQIVVPGQPAAPSP